MAAYKPKDWGTVNIGVPTITGKQRPDPRNQEFQSNPDMFVSEKGQKPPMSVTTHQNIKDLIANGAKPSHARKIALAKNKESTDTGAITKKEIYRHKFQAEQPGHQMSPFKTQVQEFPFI